MPGIVGLITKRERRWAEAQLLRMTETLCHEHFYRTGTWIDESLGVYVAWIARENSFSDMMPLRNESGNVVLVFSGEEFPEPGIARRLKERGHTLDVEGPSYLVHLYEEDPAFLENLNGRFQALLTDRTRATVTLFNDRYGMHRIYYHESKEAFYFAVEAKAILAVRPEVRSVDPRGLGEFVSCGCVLQNRTIFKDIHILPPASAWTFRNGVIDRKGVYFEPREWEQQQTLTPELYYQELRGVFSRNLPRYFNGPERIGMSLTGGLDTRAILAWQQPAPLSLPCYTFGGPFRDCRDVTVARRVAQEWGQSHEVIRVGGDFLSRFPHYAERTVYLSDGCAGINYSPDLYVNERAAKIAPIRMTGNYGDEVLRRARVFSPADPTPGVFCPDFVMHVRRAHETYAELLREHPLSFGVFRQAPWHHYGILALEQTQISVRSPYLDNDLVRTAFRSPQSAFVNNKLRIQLIHDGNPELGKIQTDLGFGAASLAGTLAQWLHRFTMKAEYTFDYGMPQWIARLDHRVSRLHFERLFLGRHKFKHFRLWYRDVLSSYVCDMLLDSRTLSRPYVRRQGVEAMVWCHLKGDRNYTSEIHLLLGLEHIHRLFLDPR